jgi:hypothetical protein
MTKSVLDYLLTDVYIYLWYTYKKEFSFFPFGTEEGFSCSFSKEWSSDATDMFQNKDDIPSVILARNPLITNIKSNSKTACTYEKLINSEGKLTNLLKLESFKLVWCPDDSIHFNMAENGSLVNSYLISSCRRMSGYPAFIHAENLFYSFNNGNIHSSNTNKPAIKTDSIIFFWSNGTELRRECGPHSLRLKGLKVYATHGHFDKVTIDDIDFTWFTDNKREISNEAKRILSTKNINADLLSAEPTIFDNPEDEFVFLSEI